MLPKTYIETSIVSYLAARPSRDAAAKVHQDVTRAWWERRRSQFELYISEVVLAEAAKGDQEAANTRIAVVQSLPVLAISNDARRLAAAILASTPLTAKSAADACTSRLRL